jgi:hypothetical protein
MRLRALPVTRCVIGRLGADPHKVDEAWIAGPAIFAARVRPGEPLIGRAGGDEIGRAVRRVDQVGRMFGYAGPWLICAHRRDHH